MTELEFTHLIQAGHNQLLHWFFSVVTLLSLAAMLRALQPLGFFGL